MSRHRAPIPAWATSPKILSAELCSSSARVCALVSSLALSSSVRPELSGRQLSLKCWSANSTAAGCLSSGPSPIARRRSASICAKPGVWIARLYPHSSTMVGGGNANEVDSSSSLVLVGTGLASRVAASLVFSPSAGSSTLAPPSAAVCSSSGCVKSHSRAMSTLREPLVCRSACTALASENPISTICATTAGFGGGGWVLTGTAVALPDVSGSSLYA
mmetsp:Transcript_2524/g.9077  ORF Transcript_2524/g.9077 Transcript_2524/m.9077 type:complete len:218 (+) Transcript_2524:6183-6836(+)